jgi:hypothetical protein
MTNEKDLDEKERKEISSVWDDLYAFYLPSSGYYERSHMHRDIVTHQ